MSVIDLPVVTQLSRDDVPAMCAHLLRLDDIDRVQRFGQPAQDAVIEHYLNSLDFERDAHYGVYIDADEGRVLIGLCHLAVARTGNMAEIGVSVDAARRRRGIAARLLERAMLHACNLSIPEVVMYFLPYNTGLMELARQYGMRIQLGHGEGIALLSSQPASPSSIAAEMIESLSELADRSVRHLADGARESSETWRRAVQDEAP